MIERKSSVETPAAITRPGTVRDHIENLLVEDEPLVGAALQRPDTIDQLTPAAIVSMSQRGDQPRQMGDAFFIAFFRQHQTLDNGTFLDTHAWVLFQLEDYEGAKKYMDLAFKNELEPSGVMLEHYGDILYHLGKKAEAISFWKKAETSPEASDKLSQKIREGKYYE